MTMVGQLPAGCLFSAFSIGAMQLPYVAMAALAGGNVRVGLEDNIYLARRAGDQPPARRAGRDDPRGHERTGPRPRRSAGEAGLAGPWLTRRSPPSQRRRARWRGDRRRLGGAIRAQRRRRGSSIPTPRRPEGRRDARQCSPRLPQAHARAASRRGRADVRGERRGGGRRGRLVQESAPEREEVKRTLLATACRAAGPEVVFGSSTSGLLPSRLQADMEHPERLAVGHPFNPVYLLAGRGVRRRANVAGDPRAGRGCLPLRGDVAARPAQGGGGVRRTAFSSAPGRRRRTTTARSRRSTTRSATAQACAGRSWAPS